jgi:hypothetical protein
MVRPDIRRLIPMNYVAPIETEYWDNNGSAEYPWGWTGSLSMPKNPVGAVKGGLRSSSARACPRRVPLGDFIRWYPSMKADEENEGAQEKAA